MYSEAVARGDILGAVLLVVRHGKVVEEPGVPEPRRRPLQEYSRKTKASSTKLADVGFEGLVS